MALHTQFQEPLSSPETFRNISDRQWQNLLVIWDIVQSKHVQVFLYRIRVIVCGCAIVQDLPCHLSLSWV